MFTFLISSCLIQVQSEILKKWKRWKLGRNIEEEYRHTYSNTPNTKTGSLLNHISPLPETTATICSPEERRMLVLGCHNGLVDSKDQCIYPLQERTIGGKYVPAEEAAVKNQWE